MGKIKLNNKNTKSSSGKFLQGKATSHKQMKAQSNSHMSMVMKKYGGDYGKKGVEVEAFLKKNGYPAVAQFLGNGK